MKKVTLDLTEKEFAAISQLLAAFNVNQYRKAKGEKIVTASYLETTTETARVLTRLDNRINNGR